MARVDLDSHLVETAVLVAVAGGIRPERWAPAQFIELLQVGGEKGFLDNLDMTRVQWEQKRSIGVADGRPTGSSRQQRRDRRAVYFPAVPSLRCPTTGN
jgi:hypothetical protein